MAAAVAIIIRKQREIAEVFQGARATSVGTARYPADLGLEEDRIFRGLVDRAIVRGAGDGRYYLDEPGWTAHNTMRRKRALVVLAVMIVFFALVIGTTIIPRL